MKIIIIGADGQLAFDLINVLKDSNEINEARRSDFDITDKEGVSRFIDTHRPNAVINTAAFHNTKECELNPEKSFQVNAVGAFYVAESCKKVGARCVLMSSDYVFNGSREFFNEDDLPDPLNVYGTSKLAGENLVKIASSDYLIIRTTGLFGPKKSGKGHTFPTLMLDKAKNKENIKVVDDQFCSPTYSKDLAEKIKELLDKNVPSGIYHLVNQGSCSWYEFAKHIFTLTNTHAKLSSMKTTEDVLHRPRYSVLKSVKLEKVGIRPLRPWPDALEDYLKTL